MQTRLWIKIITDETGQIGPGKIALLKAIAEHGSISAAARALAMSYRRAWLLVEDTAAAVGGPVVETHTGGAGKGGAALNARGRDLIALYDRVEDRANRAVEQELQAFFGPKQAAPNASEAE